MEKDKSEMRIVVIVFLLLGSTIYLLIRNPFAVIVILISLGAIVATFAVKDVIWSRRLKLISGFFALLFVLHLIKLSSNDDVEEKKIVLSPEQQTMRKIASDKEQAYRYLKRINRHTEVAISPVEAANCLMAIDRAEEGSSDWAVAKDKCLGAASHVDIVR